MAISIRENYLTRVHKIKTHTTDTKGTNRTKGLQYKATMYLLRSLNVCEQYSLCTIRLRIRNDVQTQSATVQKYA
jgi:hypothetical protein